MATTSRLGASMRTAVATQLRQRSSGAGLSGARALRWPRSRQPSLQQWHALRHCSTAPAGDGESSSSSSDLSPKIAELVEKISSLSLLEASELTEALKTRLGITSAMMMPAGGGVAAGGGGGAPAEAAGEAEAPAAEKTHFTVKLEAFDAGSKSTLTARAPRHAHPRCEPCASPNRAHLTPMPMRTRRRSRTPKWCSAVPRHSLALAHIRALSPCAQSS